MLLRPHRLRVQSQCTGAATPHIRRSTRHPACQGAVRWEKPPTLAPCARLERLLGADRRAGQHHLTRRLQAHQAWQPLRAAKARQDAQLQLRQAQLGACAAGGGEACQEPRSTRCRRAASCKGVHSARIFQVCGAGTTPGSMLLCNRTSPQPPTERGWPHLGSTAARCTPGRSPGRRPGPRPRWLPRSAWGHSPAARRSCH
jgi:hypothetical protein